MPNLPKNCKKTARPEQPGTEQELITVKPDVNLDTRPSHYTNLVFSGIVDQHVINANAGTGKRPAYPQYRILVKAHRDFFPEYLVLLGPADTDRFGYSSTVPTFYFFMTENADFIDNLDLIDVPKKLLYIVQEHLKAHFGEQFVDNLCQQYFKKEPELTKDDVLNLLEVANEAKGIKKDSEPYYSQIVQPVNAPDEESACLVTVSDYNPNYDEFVVEVKPQSSQLWNDHGCGISTVYYLNVSGPGEKSNTGIISSHSETPDYITDAVDEAVNKGFFKHESKLVAKLRANRKQRNLDEELEKTVKNIADLMTQPKQEPVKPNHPKTMEELIKTAELAAKETGKKAQDLLKGLYTDYADYLTRLTKEQDNVEPISIVSYYHTCYKNKWTQSNGKSFTSNFNMMIDFLSNSPEGFFYKYPKTTIDDYEATKEDLWKNWFCVATEMYRAIILNLVGDDRAKAQNNLIVLNSWVSDFTMNLSTLKEVPAELTDEVMSLMSRRAE